jgi:hypothetical protein
LHFPKRDLVGMATGPQLYIPHNTPPQTAGGNTRSGNDWMAQRAELHSLSSRSLAVGVPFYPSDLITHNACFPALKRRSVCDSNWVGWGLVANVRGGNNSTIELSGPITSCTSQNEISLG